MRCSSTIRPRVIFRPKNTMASDDATDAMVATLLKTLEENGEVANSIELAAKLGVDHQEVRATSAAE